jgi:protein-L-isoaspartate(D-aspartate) O-methyltransferase
MVKRQIEARGVKDPLVLKAMRKVPRHEFVPDRQKSQAYADHPLSIGLDQTISQPYIVAFMTEALMIKPGDKVLEIGTGSGYQAAVLGEITKNVYSIEILCDLEKRARRDLDRLGYKHVITKCGDGYQGWTEHAPFDAVIVTAAPDHVPRPLIDQLKIGGRLVIPVGSWFQELIRITRTRDGKKEERLLGVRFVPMTGEAQEKK